MVRPRNAAGLVPSSGRLRRRKATPRRFLVGQRAEKSTPSETVECKALKKVVGTVSLTRKNPLNRILARNGMGVKLPNITTEQFKSGARCKYQASLGFLDNKWKLVNPSEPGSTKLLWSLVRETTKLRAEVIL